MNSKKREQIAKMISWSAKLMSLAVVMGVAVGCGSCDKGTPDKAELNLSLNPANIKGNTKSSSLVLTNKSGKDFDPGTTKEYKLVIEKVEVTLKEGKSNTGGVTYVFSHDNAKTKHKADKSQELDLNTVFPTGTMKNEATVDTTVTLEDIKEDEVDELKLVFKLMSTKDNKEAGTSATLTWKNDE